MAAALAVVAGEGYWLYAAKQKREQHAALVALVGSTTAELRKALAGTPAPDVVQKLDGNLKALNAPREPQLAQAAGSYIHDAREIARRRVDAERLAREAALNRRALAMHMSAASNRDPYWIRVASDLKKRVERDHSDLDVSLKSLAQLLGALPETQKSLAPHLDAALLLEEETRRSAREQAEAGLKAAQQELEKTRKLAAR
jgi:hypothetical protein